MRLSSSAAILFLICSFGILPNAWAQTNTDTTKTDFEITNPMNVTPKQYTIQRIDVIGADHLNASFIPASSGLEEGAQITVPGEDIPDAIKRLYRTGLFSDVKVRVTQRIGSEIFLEIVVQEQPRLDKYKLKGVKRSQKKDLQERLNLLTGYAVKSSTKAQAVNTIKRFFRTKGYWHTSVDIETTKTDTVRNRVTLVFDIDPGQRLEIKDIAFEGNDSFKERKLIREMDEIKEDAWWKIFSKKLFKEEEYETAKENLINFYKENGFLDVYIERDSVYVYNYKDDKEGIRVQLEINEGEQYKVRNIEWEGNTVYTDDRLTQALGFEKGDVFNQTNYDQNLNFNKDNSDVTSLYHDIGYLFFQVQPEIERVAEDSLDLHFQIYEDETATIDEVDFTGNNKTHDDVVRRTLRTIPGKTYSRSAIVRTVRELGTLGYFKADKISPDLQPDYQQKTVDISYQLDESQSTDNFEFSGGFGGRNVGLILSARLNFNNFSIQRAFTKEGWPIPSGDGQKLSLGVQVTGRGYQSYSISFQEPWLSGKPISFGISTSYDLIKYRGSDIKNELFSSSVSLGKRLKWPDDYFSIRSVLSYQLYDVVGQTYLSEGTANIISLKQELERNSLDNFISPTRGSKFTLSGEIAPPIPDFNQYYKLKSSYQHHTQTIDKLVFTNSIEFGYIGYLGTGNRSNFKRFYLGGTQIQQRQSFINDNIDLRGFPGGQGGSISPISDGEFVGGRLYTKYSVEMRYPAVNSDQVQLYPYAFFDAGNAYENIKNFEPYNLKRSTGLGMRIFLPVLGLVDLSYGYRLDGIPQTTVNAGEWEFLFNIGAPF
ncbi:MAG: outer membrane protein assembly factor BamA [Bacteroidota bacterium]